MDEEVYNLVLNEMPFKEFIIYYIFSLAGAVAFFLYSLYQAIKYDNTTPTAFQWKYFAKGAIRVFLTVILIAVAIVFWEQISLVIFAGEDPVELNGWSAFLLGVLSDRLLEGVLGSGQDASKYVRKKLKNGTN
jgi:hypothetical protein